MSISAKGSESEGEEPKFYNAVEQAISSGELKKFIYEDTEVAEMILRLEKRDPQALFLRLRGQIDYAELSETPNPDDFDLEEFFTSLENVALLKEFAPEVFKSKNFKYNNFLSVCKDLIRKNKSKPENYLESAWNLKQAFPQEFISSGLLTSDDWDTISGLLGADFNEGNFDRFLELYSYAIEIDCAEIYKRFLIGSKEWEEIAKYLSSYSGNDLEKLVCYAHAQAIRPTNEKDIVPDNESVIQALDEIKDSYEALGLSDRNKVEFFEEMYELVFRIKCLKYLRIGSEFNLNEFSLT